MRKYLLAAICSATTSLVFPNATQSLLQSIQNHQFALTYEQAMQRQSEGNDAYSLSVAKMSQEYVDELYHQLEVFAKVMNQNDVKWAISSGTLLGAWRNGGLIMGDDDIDVFVDLKDAYVNPPNTNVLWRLDKENPKRYTDKWKKVLADFAKEGFEPDNRDWRVYKVVDKKRSSDLEKKYNMVFPGLDIFFMVKKGNRYRYYDNFAFALWGKAWRAMQAPVSIWEGDFVDVKFGHLSVKSFPEEFSMKHLRDVYGDDVLEVTYKVMDHTQQKAWKGAKFKTKLLLEEDYYFIAGSKDPNFLQYPFRSAAKLDREYYVDGSWRRGDLSVIKQKVFE